MALDVHLRDDDSGYTQNIDKSGASLNIVKPIPPFASKSAQKMRIFREFLADSAGNTDMRVNGSSTNVDYFIQAQSKKDLYITNVAFTISDLNATLNSFGTLSALANGCVFEYEDEQGVVIIHDALKSNYDFVQVSLGNPPFGDGTGAFRASNVSGNSEGYLPIVDFRRVFGFQWGILLRAGSKQRITLRVRDDTSGVDRFDAIAYGFTREKD